MTKTKPSIKVLSLFDGISCARVALERAGFKVEKYLASEIDESAVSISARNWPDIIQLGDVKNITKKVAGGGIDLLIGGSPCQDLSKANINRKGLAGSRSGLFFEYLRILKEVKPRYFILENVASMSEEARQTITDALGVQPIMIDAALVSAQRRKRLFWTNIPGIELPADRGIEMKHILVDERKFKYPYQYRGYSLIDGVAKLSSDPEAVKQFSIPLRVREATKAGFIDVKLGDCVDLVQPNSKTRRGRNMAIKSNCLLTGDMQYYRLTKKGLRKLIPVECERLQGLPDGYTEGSTEAQRNKAIGNGFNADVITHLVSHIK